MSKSPAFQWYPKDILSSARVQEMSLVEECAYRRLIDYCWINGSVPKCPKRAAVLVGKRVSSVAIKKALSMFIPHPEKPEELIHERLEQEREKQATTKKKRKEAADARWAKENPDACKSNANALHETMQMQCLASSSSSATAVINTLSPTSLSEPVPERSFVEGGRAGEVMSWINTIRSEWRKPAHWNHSEQRDLFDGTLSQILELNADDRRLIERFMREDLPKAAGFWQPHNRSKFVQTFSQVFASAQRWAEKKGIRHDQPSASKGVIR